MERFLPRLAFDKIKLMNIEKMSLRAGRGGSFGGTCIGVSWSLILRL